MSATDLGTLMWIGPRHGEFDSPHQYCVRHAAQLAVRDDCDQALQRRATTVRGIVVARANRAAISVQTLERLQRRYSAADVLHLTGALCEGMRSGDDLPSANRIPWHRWDELLPQWLQRWGDAEAKPIRQSTSVAVIASHFQAAEPLMELAGSTGATTVWLRSPQCTRAQNFDAVWWDDSVAPGTDESQWRKRIETVAASAAGAEHCWITGHASPDQFESARAAGIARIVTKPYRIEKLLEMLVSREETAVRAAA